MTEYQRSRILSESPQHGPVLLGELDAATAALRSSEALVQRICRESGAVLFQDGEVRNHRAERAEAQLALSAAVVEELKEALRVFKRYGTHRGSCVQMTGKACSCGFDAAATKAGGLAALTKPEAGEKL